TPRVLGTLGLFAYALLRLMPLAARVATNLANFRSGLPILDDLLRDVAAARTTLGADPRAPASAAPRRALGAIEFDQVSCRYEDALRPALRDVTLRIEPGTFVAIVGTSGAGKSTLIDLLLGLLAPASGTVLVDGRTPHELSAGWQASVGVVSQEPY